MIYKKINEIQKSISQIKLVGKTVYTNYYNQCKDCLEQLKCWKTEKAIVFEYNDLGIKRIYFYAVDTNDLISLLSTVDAGSVIDIITKDKNKLSEVFRVAGYKRYAEYGRFYINSNNERTQEFRNSLHEEQVQNLIVNGEYGEPALISDAEEIDKQLREEFDPYESHFYSLEKLREHIAKGWVWVVKKDDKIVAANLFEIQGRKVYGAYLYNKDEVDVMYSLVTKTDEYIAKQGVIYAYCWMRLNNIRAVRFNQKYHGFVADGLYDIIYLKE